MKLVDDWKRAHRWWSVRLAVLTTAALQGWTMLPEDLKSQIPPELMAKIASGLALLTIIGRLVSQDMPGDQEGKP